MIGFTLKCYTTCTTFNVASLCATIGIWTFVICRICISNCKCCGIIAISTLTRFIICCFVYTVCSRYKILVINFILVICMGGAYCGLTTIIFCMNIFCTTIYHFANTDRRRACATVLCPHLEGERGCDQRVRIGELRGMDLADPLFQNRGIYRASCA